MSIFKMLDLGPMTTIIYRVYYYFSFDRDFYVRLGPRPTRDKSKRKLGHHNNDFLNNYSMRKANLPFYYNTNCNTVQIESKIMKKRKFFLTHSLIAIQFFTFYKHKVPLDVITVRCWGSQFRWGRESFQGEEQNTQNQRHRARLDFDLFLQITKKSFPPNKKHFLPYPPRPCPPTLILLTPQPWWKTPSRSLRSQATTCSCK